MVGYRDESVFPASRNALWKLLEAHLDPAQISLIHPLVKSQRVLSRAGDETVVERVVEARGRTLTSQWKITYRVPDTARWEILGGDGPWAAESYLENRYTDDPGGTRIQTHADLRITVVPFFFPQGLILKGIMDTIDKDDRAYLAKLPR